MSAFFRRDTQDKLFCLDPAKRLGAGSVDEIKNNPFFMEDIFIPKAADPQDTSNFTGNITLLRLGLGFFSLTWKVIYLLRSDGRRLALFFCENINKTL